MKQRKNISFFLLLVSFIMLTASVFPHHHHQEIFCIQSDTESSSIDHLNLGTNCCEVECSHAANSDDCCSESETSDKCDFKCITHFHFSEPDVFDNVIEPDYTLEYILYSLTDLFNQEFYSELSNTEYCCYHCPFHTIQCTKASGLRAPPYFIALS